MGDFVDEQKVDNTTTLDSGKFRDSVRIHSKTPMKIGSIVIADIIKMPFGCSTWPGPSKGDLSNVRSVED